MIKTFRKAIKSKVFGALQSHGYQVREKEWRIHEMTKEDLELLRKVQPYTMTTRERLWGSVVSIRHVVRNRIPGAFVECGVWRGGQALLAAYELQREGDLRSIYLFDTFAGMVEPTDHDVRVDGEIARSEYEASKDGDINRWCYASLEDVTANVSRSNYRSDLIKYVRGPVEVTLRDAANLPEQIAVLRLDTDWYESTKVEMEVLYPRLASRGILMIDDYGAWQGARKAVDEYFVGLGMSPLLIALDEECRLFVKP